MLYSVAVNRLVSMYFLRCDCVTLAMPYKVVYGQFTSLSTGFALLTLEFWTGRSRAL